MGRSHGAPRRPLVGGCGPWCWLRPLWCWLRPPPWCWRSHGGCGPPPGAGCGPWLVETPKSTVCIQFACKLDFLGAFGCPKVQFACKLDTNCTFGCPKSPVCMQTGYKLDFLILAEIQFYKKTNRTFSFFLRKLISNFDFPKLVGSAFFPNCPVFIQFACKLDNFKIKSPEIVQFACKLDKNWTIWKNCIFHKLGKIEI